MGLEASVTTITDLNSAWPLTTDERSQGDDHLRNIKVALKSLIGGTWPAGIVQLGFGASPNPYEFVRVNAGETAFDYSPGFVDRGDVSGSDWTDTTLTTDGTWRDLNLSSIVPAGAKAVLLRLYISDDATGSEINFRKNGHVGSYNWATLGTQAANIANYASLVVAVDSNRVIEYMASNRTFTAISIVVAGWWF